MYKPSRVFLTLSFVVRFVNQYTSINSIKGYFLLLMTYYRTQLNNETFVEKNKQVIIIIILYNQLSELNVAD